MNRHPRRKLTTAVLGACLGVALLGGCSPAPDLDTAVAGQLQTRVASAKERAAAQDFPSALAELQQLNQDVAAAAEQGKVSQQRKARIEAAISTIRSDLETALAPAPTPADQPLSKDEQERLEEAQKEAEKQREEAQKEAEKLLEEAQEEAEKQRKEAQEEAEKQRNRD